jgi:hypothetical protein
MNPPLTFRALCTTHHFVDRFFGPEHRLSYWLYQKVEKAIETQYANHGDTFESLAWLVYPGQL